jgi:F0F1-type ATP synthase epsilon subunit
MEEVENKNEEKPEVPKGQMWVKIYSPFRSYYDALANSISAVNMTGPFDILPGHHKFLTLVSSCDIEVSNAEGEEKIKIEQGIMYVKEDRVIVFLDV